jgi:hypothetical protein
MRLSDDIRALPLLESVYVKVLGSSCDLFLLYAHGKCSARLWFRKVLNDEFGKWWKTRKRDEKGWSERCVYFFRSMVVTDVTTRGREGEG